MLLCRNLLIISTKYYPFPYLRLSSVKLFILTERTLPAGTHCRSVITSRLCIHLVILTNRFGKASDRYKFCNTTGDKMSCRCTYVYRSRETSTDNYSIMLGCKNIMPLLDSKTLYRKNQVFLFFYTSRL